MQDFKKNRHSVYGLKYHLVVVTKYRNKCINHDILTELKEISNRLIEDKNGTLLEFNGEEDHIHLLFEFPPQVELAKWINSFKTVTSRLIRKNHAEYLKKFYWKDVFWARSYFVATTGGATIDVIKKYIENQGSEKD
jgi:putative transposase